MKIKYGSRLKMCLISAPYSLHILSQQLQEWIIRKMRKHMVQVSQHIAHSAGPSVGRKCNLNLRKSFASFTWPNYVIIKMQNSSFGSFTEYDSSNELGKVSYSVLSATITSLSSLWMTYKATEEINQGFKENET